MSIVCTSSDQIRGTIRTTIGTIIFWMLCSYVRSWKYKWVTSFSFVDSWVRKNHCRTCTDFLVNASSSYDFALDWVTQTSAECVTFDYELTWSYITTASRRIDWQKMGVPVMWTDWRRKFLVSGKLWRASGAKRRRGTIRILTGTHS